MSVLEEIQEIERLVKDLGADARLEVIGESAGPERWPIYKVSYGCTDPKAPVLGLVGGVHGLERIGSRVCLALMTSFSRLLRWDKNTRNAMADIRVFFIPAVNPWGLHHKRRSNFNGVDLMRNAPIDGEGQVTPLIGGHRFSARLPWYRGDDSRLEPESAALVDTVEKEISQARVAITVDFHSGFGLLDRIWFPYAKSLNPYPEIHLMHSFKELFDNTYPHHVYRIEPQAINYTTHGDLWDYLYDRHRAKGCEGIYLPMCMEMGSWTWVRKNPMQFFSMDGAFNPMVHHRMRRTLRRHLPLFDFLLRATSSPEAWSALTKEQSARHRNEAMRLWYGV